jgi:hypothetical protein
VDQTVDGLPVALEEVVEGTAPQPARRSEPVVRRVIAGVRNLTGFIT